MIKICKTKLEKELLIELIKERDKNYSINKTLDFLMKRDNKLQRIEMMFKSGKFDLNDEDNLQDDTSFQKEIERTKAITSIGTTIINNAKLALDAKKYADEYGTDKAVPLMLQEKKQK